VTLFVSTELGLDSFAKSDLFMATPADVGLSDVAVPGDPSAVQMTYARSKSGFAPELIEALVNTEWSNPVVVYPVDASFVLPDGSPVTEHVGQTLPADEDPYGLDRIVAI